MKSKPEVRRPHHPLRMLGLPPSIWRVVHEYCQHSSLHGLRYVSSIDLPYIERYLWLGVFIASVGFAVNLIYGVWMLWREMPFFITFDTVMTPTWNIPFPSVTLCSYSTIKQSVIDLATTNNNTVLFYASLICPMHQAKLKKFTTPDFVGNEIYSFLQQAGPSCSEMLKICSFEGKSFNCCDWFEPVVTDIGLCYSFNSLPAFRILKDAAYKPFPGIAYPPEARFWTPDNGYPRGSTRYDENVFPRRVTVSGEYSSLIVELFQNNSEWQQLCAGGYTGFRARLSNPADLPVFTKVDVRIAMSRETSLMLTPSFLGSHDDLTPIPPPIRACFINHEKPLQFFSQYTNTNCHLECHSQRTLQECGCVPFEFPRMDGTKVCSKMKELTCMKNAKNKLTREAIGRDDRAYSFPCNCLPECQEIVYKATDFYSDFIHTGNKEPPWANGTIIGPHSVTRLTVFFKDSYFRGQHRIMRYNNLKFAGTCGGLLSLLLGFSVISAIEIVYIFVLRPLNRALKTRYQRRRTNVIVVEPVRALHP